MSEDDVFDDFIAAVEGEGLMKPHESLGDGQHHVRPGLMQEGWIES